MTLHTIKGFLATAIIAATTLLAATSCSDELDRPDIAPLGSQPATLVFECSDMLPQFIDPTTVSSRASDNKTQEEKAIRTLHLFFFNHATGKFLTPDKGDQNFKPYQVIERNVITIPDRAFIEMDDPSATVDIYAVANINASDKVNHFLTEWTLADGSLDGTYGGMIENGTRDSETPAPYKITCRADLEKWVYRPKLRSEEGTDINHLPKAGMPMIGKLTGILLHETPGTTRQIIPMTALMARVDISIKLTPNQQSLDGQLPTMTITGYGIKNMPTAVPFAMPSGSRIGDNDGDVTTTDMETELEVTLDNPVTINKDSNPVTFSYYTYENIQLPDYKALRPDGSPAFDSQGNIQYPSGVAESEYQRWKPTIARKDRASAMILKANYTTHQGIDYRAQFTVFMGQNPESDFQVKRNHQYNNNISIHGLDYVRNSEDNTYTFDGRVNVISDNPLYLAIVNERKVDAHATALPMDVWLLLRENAPQGGDAEYDWNSTVTISLRNPNDPNAAIPDWIRMEKVPRSIMKGNSPNPSEQFLPGTGARPYFTENLLQEIGDNGIEVEIDGNRDKSRSRVYFYIDENIPAKTEDPNYKDRVATIYITYSNTRERNASIHRTLEIEQRSLVFVKNWTSCTPRPVIGGYDTAEINAYMEYYEEYLEHNDPLDKHEMPGELYDGLPWGLNGEAVNGLLRGILSGTYGSMIYYEDDAFSFTKAIMGKYSNIADIKLFNNHVPESAFHYCYGKNKRAADGSVTIKDYGWYMPGIRQLEAALVQYYNTFPTFKGQLYWSCANGKNNATGSSEITDQARATGIVENGTGFNYIESSKGQAGSRPRTDKLRIRAFYKPEKKN